MGLHQHGVSIYTVLEPLSSLAFTLLSLNAYLQEAINALRTEMARLVPVICQQVAACCCCSVALTCLLFCGFCRWLSPCHDCHVTVSSSLLLCTVYGVLQINEELGKARKPASGTSPGRAVTSANKNPLAQFQVTNQLIRCCTAFVSSI